MVRMSFPLSFDVHFSTSRYVKVLVIVLLGVGYLCALVIHMKEEVERVKFLANPVLYAAEQADDLVVVPPSRLSGIAKQLVLILLHIRNRLRVDLTASKVETHTYLFIFGQREPCLSFEKCWRGIFSKK